MSISRRRHPETSAAWYSVGLRFELDWKLINVYQNRCCDVDRPSTPASSAEVPAPSLLQDALSLGSSASETTD